MDFIKSYICQSISTAANNLRLNSQRIEVVALLKEIITSSDDLERDLKEMKKITELSTLAIRLSEINNFLSQGQIDFLKITEKFKEHSRNLIKDLSHLLDLATPTEIKTASDKIKKKPEPEKTELPLEPMNNDEIINLDFTNRKTDEDCFEKIEEDVKEISVTEGQENKKTKKEYAPMINDKLESGNDADLELKFEREVNNGEAGENIFENFDDVILKPIKSLDSILNEIELKGIAIEEVEYYTKLLNKNSSLASDAHFELMARMHSIAAKALNMFAYGILEVNKEEIENIRACLIVIAALVKGKNVDITTYLNKAELFGNKLSKIKGI